MKNVFLVIAALILLAACKRDFSVNADYEDFPIVMGLIKTSEKTHYVKVYKSFVTEHNAYDAAKDIHFYSYIDSVDVYMEEYDAKGKVLRTIAFDTTTEIPKNAGIFAFPTQILYKTNAELNPQYTYQLFVYNRFTKKMAYSNSISLADNVVLSRPVSYLLTITDGSFIIDFYPSHNTYLYEFSLTFYYSEIMKDYSVKQGKPIEWNIGQLPAQSSSSLLLSYSTSQGSILFQRIANGIANNENVISRHTDSIVLSVSSAGKDWYYYILANRPSSGINQNRLDYTNISAYKVGEEDKKLYALGLFSSRETTNKMFRDFTIAANDSLFHGRYTGHLKFTNIY